MSRSEVLPLLTLKQLTEKLHDALNRELVEPLVSLSLQEAGKREVPVAC